MKTTRIFAALMPLLMFSCAKENIVPEDNNTKPSEEIKTDGGEKYQFAVTLSPETGSKAAFDDSKGIIWLAGGKASIAKDGDESVIASAELTDEKISEDKYSATFNFEATEGTYRLFYPHNEASKYDNFRVEVPQEQFQNATGMSADIFATIADEDITLSADNTSVPDLKYHVVGSYLRFIIYGSEHVGETVESIRISASSPLAGSYDVHNDYSTTINERTEGELVVAAGCQVTASAEEVQNGIYAAVLNGEYSSITYTVKTDKQEYEFHSETARTFKNGEIKDVKLNLDKAVPTNIYLIGSSTYAEWNLGNAMEMTRNGRTYEITTYLRTGKVEESGELVDRGFKFICSKNGYWPAYVNGGDNISLVYHKTTEEGDVKFTAPHDGLYKITADLETMQISLELCPLYLVGSITGWQFDNGNPLLMEASGNPGEFKAEKVYVSSSNSGNNEFKFAFRKGAEGQIDYDYYIVPDNGKANYEIAMGVEYNENGTSKADAISKDFAITSMHNSEGDAKWTVKSTYENKCYDITVNLIEKKLTMKLSQGNTFWIFGINGVWERNDAYKAVAENGIASWTLDINNKCDFKICGENTLENVGVGDIWSGEWYYSPLDSEGKWWWVPDNYGSEQPSPFENAGDRKWWFEETGNYTITFDSRNLKLTVVKNN